MPHDKNEVDKFFENLSGEQAPESNIFEDEGVEPQAPAAKQEGEENPAKGEEPRKNRRHRRLEDQLQKERELRIAAEAKAAGKAEADANRPASNDDVPEKWLRMYGDTPEARQAWGLQKELFADVKNEAKREALAEIEAKQAATEKARTEFETFIDNEFENIEDEFDVDLTSDAPAARKARREFLELIQSLSPKDANGSLTGYADFEQTFKLYQTQKGKAAPDVSKQKEIASRGMNQSGDSAAAPAKTVTPGFRGWMKDLNFNE